MNRSIPEPVLQRMLKDRSAFASSFRYAVLAAQASIDSGRPEVRLDALGRYAIWFASTDTATEWLELLWTSTSGGTALRLRPALLDMVRRAVRQLPRAGEEGNHELAMVLPVMLNFIQRHGLGELMPAVHQRAFGAGGWIHSAALRSRLLWAAYACSLTYEGWQFLARVTQEPKVLRALDYRQLMVFALEFLAGSQDQLQRPQDRAALRAALDRLTQEAMHAADRPELLSPLTGFEDFRNEVVRGLQEVCAQQMGDQETRSAIGRLQNALLSYEYPDLDLYTRPYYQEVMRRIGMQIPAPRPDEAASQS